MRKNLHPILMATVIATFLSLTTPYVQAEVNSPAAVITTTTDDNGHKIYVNEETAPRSTAKQSEAPARQNSLVYWSSTQKRWKPVPSANIRAARSAADEVSHYLGSSSSNPELPSANFTRGKIFTQQDIDAAIDQAAARHNVDPNLVRAVIKVESNFNPNAVSRKGAMGLMQLMPQTARQLHVSNPFDPQQNVDAGVRHLKKLIESYGGDVKLSLAAYNAGAGAVARSRGVPRYGETRNYVKRITGLYNNGAGSASLFGSPIHEPLRIERDERGVLHVSNTD